MNNQSKTIVVDEDSYNFLIKECFKGQSNHYKSAARRSYLDMCRRTLKTGGKNTNKARSRVEEMLEQEIKKLLSIVDKNYTQTDFNNWHESVCDKMIADFYKEVKLTLSYGQSQKWLNMTMKYLFAINEKGFEELFEFLHAPIDSTVINEAKKIGVKMGTSWSKIDDYEKYSKFQNDLSIAVKEKGYPCLLRWELQIWNNK